MKDIKSWFLIDSYFEEKGKEDLRHFGKRNFDIHPPRLLFDNEKKTPEEIKQEEKYDEISKVLNDEKKEILKILYKPVYAEWANLLFCYLKTNHEDFITWADKCIKKINDSEILSKFILDKVKQLSITHKVKIDCGIEKGGYSIGDFFKNWPCKYIYFKTSTNSVLIPICGCERVHWNGKFQSKKRKREGHECMITEPELKRSKVVEKKDI